MIWQDAVLSVGQFIFVIALLPSVLSRDKPSLFTSLTTGAVLIVFAFTYITLSLWFGATMVFVSALVWLLLGYQKYRTKNKQISQ